MKEAEEIDKEEAAERDEQKARMPEVAKGLELPDQDGVFVLDTFQGTPELVELVPSELGMQCENQARPQHAESPGRRTRRASSSMARTPRCTCTSTIRPSISRSTPATTPSR